MRTPIVATVLVAAGVSLSAHDFWLASSRWHVAPGATVTVTANVGDDIYPKSEVATAANRVDTLQLVGPATTTLMPAYREPSCENPMA